MKRLRAISIRQPFVEQIMRRTKKFEFRSIPTNVRGRVYVYASKGKRPAADWRGMGVGPEDVPIGVIVGTVEIVGCQQRGLGDYAWALRAPRRLRRPVKPTGHPQPVWFYPFGR
jgi:hypothetical protein